MSTKVQDALNQLRSLGTVAQLQASGEAPASRPRVNSHIHLPPNFSAFTTVKQAVDLAAAQQVGVLGVSNYYDYDVYGDFVELAQKQGIFPLLGLEIICLIDELVKSGVKINDPGNPGKFYICGKGITRFDQMTAEAQRLLGLIRRSDSQRMATIIAKLGAIFAERGVAVGLDEAAVIDMVVNRHGCPRPQVYLQERHVCQAFQEALFRAVPAERRIEALTKVLGTAPKAGADEAVKIQNEIRAHLLKAGKPGYVEETFVNFEQAYRLILELGGIPCYPTLADGTSPICGFEQPAGNLIDNLKSRNIHLAEFIPLRNSPEVLREHVLAMRKAGLAVVGGTEHNTLELVGIEPTCVGGKAVPEDVKQIFWEGACVVAAHQFLTLHGQCGFVDTHGNPHPAYGNAEQRIAAFAKLGAAVIARYYKRSGR